MLTKFIKMIGRGILYIFLCPFLILLVALFSVVGLFIFLFLCVKSLFLFFYGKTIFSDLPEDIEARRILSAKLDNNVEPKIVTEEIKEDVKPDILSVYPSDSNMYKSEYNKPVENVENNIPQENNVVDEVEESISREEKSEEIHIESPKIEDEEIIGTFTPLNSNNKDGNK